MNTNTETTTEGATKSHSSPSPCSTLILTGAQLKDALEMCGNEMETKIVIVYREAFTSTDGEEMPAGVYAYDDEYPEEGINGPLGSLSS